MGGHRSQNTLSTSSYSQGPPSAHTPMGSQGSLGAMTPQTSISKDNERGSVKQKVKTGGAFDKAKKLLSGKRGRKKSNEQQQQIQQQQQQQQQANMSGGY